MSHRLGCELANKIAGIAPVVRTFTARLADGCKPAKPISVLLLFGTADKIVPFEGGIQKMGSIESPVLSAEETIRRWAKLDECSGMEAAQDGDVQHIRYTTCKAGAGVEADIHKGAGHSWPPGAAESIWAFFEKHSADVEQKSR